MIILLAGGNKRTQTTDIKSLYRALSGERSPDFDTILKVMDALGLKLHAAASHG